VSPLNSRTVTDSGVKGLKVLGRKRNGGVDRKQRGIDGFVVVLAMQMNRKTVHWCPQQATVPRVSGHLISQQREAQTNQIQEPVSISNFILRFSLALERNYLLRYSTFET